MASNARRSMLRFGLRDLAGSLAHRSLWVFAASLFLGIALIGATGGLLQLVRGGLDTQARSVFGGDVQLSTRAPIDERARAWLDRSGQVSLLQELRTMLGTADGRFGVIEVQSVDAAYPLYGSVRLEPQMSLQQAVARDDDGLWGAVFDPALATELQLAPGDRVTIGELSLELRAAIVEQPDRSLRADVGGPPVIIDERALAASGLIGPMSLVEYDYRVRLDAPGSAAWRDALRDAFPDADWEVRTVEERGEFVTERLDQVASVLVLIGVATLLIGGLGVANGISAYLQSKRGTLATLQSLGARQGQITFVFVAQALVLALAASTVGALIGAAIAWLAGRAVATRLPLEPGVGDLLGFTLLSIVFGTLTALAFSLAPLGRAMASRPAQLLRGDVGQSDEAPLAGGFRAAIVAVGIATLLVLLLIVPEPLIGAAFAVGSALIAAVLALLARGVGHLSRRWVRAPALRSRFVWRFALGGFHRPGSAFRPMLLSLGTALTVVVACAFVIAALVYTLERSVPATSPALVFYDIQEAEREAFEQHVARVEQIDRVVTAPLVLGRLQRVNGEILSDSDDSERAFEANDEHKLGYRIAGIDGTTVTRGTLWPADYAGPALVAMEDRETDQLGLQVGDRLVFSMLGESVEAELVGIYEQATLQTRFWYEAMFSPGVLEPFITRHVGSAWLDDAAADDADVLATNAIGQAFPTVVSIRTGRALEAARSLLGAAALAVALVAAVALAASVLVMASVVAVNRRRQAFEATVLHALGARMRRVLSATMIEYALMGTVVALFAAVCGGLIGHLILTRWIELPSSGARGIVPLVAFSATALCLGAAFAWLASALKATPAQLLRESRA